MDLALNENQQMLQQSVRSFVQRRAPKGTIVALQKSPTGFQPDTWSTIAELGWLGLLVPGEYGGSGASLTDAAVLYEEFGRGPLPGPFFSSGVARSGDGSVPKRAFHSCSSAAGSSVLRVAISPARSSAAALKLCCAVLRFDEMLCAMATSIRVSMCAQFAP
jgi:Acyl-CoA dehydrogenase, N-terminal domain